MPTSTYADFETMDGKVLLQADNPSVVPRRGDAVSIDGYPYVVDTVKWHVRNLSAGITGTDIKSVFAIRVRLEEAWIAEEI